MEYMFRNPKKIPVYKNSLLYADEVESGQHDNNFSVWQEMHYFLTGECVSFLPPTRKAFLSDTTETIL